MKPFISFMLAAMAVLPAAAEQLTPEESLARLSAMHNGPSKARAFAQSQLKLAFTGTKENANTFYVFNREGNGGFVILSADDLAPEILGYCENGGFDESKVAPQFLNWLKDYSATIHRAIVANKRIAGSAQRADRRSIAPILKSKWGQGSNYDGMNIYNKYCPKVDGVLCPTGCEATAIAQIMYHFKYPAQGVGTNAYTSQTHQLSLSANFGNTTYDWDAMQDDYGVYIDDEGEYQTSTVTTRANDAVSRLMSHCGIAMNMDYAPGGSGAFTFDAMRGLVENFGYNPMMSYRIHTYYSDDQWESMIYDQIAQGIPLLYCGSTVNREGHAFVCDGYKDGLYHINWGWDGMSDGYYTILGNNSLHPKHQGTGGSYTADAFSENHEILCGFVPPQDATSPTHAFCIEGEYQAVDSDTEEPKLSNGGYAKVSFQEGAFSFTYKTCNYAFGLKLESEDSEKTYYLPFVSDVPYYDLQFLQGIGGYYVECEGVDDGVYTTTPVYRIEGEDAWTPMSCASTSPVKVAYGNAELPDPDGPENEELWLVCSNVTSTSDYDFMRTAHVRIECPGNADDKAFDGYIAPVVFDNDQNFVAVCDDIKQEFKQGASSFDRQKTFDFDVLIPDECGDQRFLISVAGISKQNLESGMWDLFYTLDLSKNDISEYNPAAEVWANGDIVTDKEQPDGGWLGYAALCCSDVTDPVEVDNNRQLRVHVSNPGNIGESVFNGWITPCLHDSDGSSLCIFPELAQASEMVANSYYSDLTYDFTINLPKELEDGTYFASIAGLQKYSLGWNNVATLYFDSDGANVKKEIPYFQFWIKGNKVSTKDPDSVVGILAPTAETSDSTVYDIYGHLLGKSSLLRHNGITISNGVKMLQR